MERNRVYICDVWELAAGLEPQSVQALVTSPPYFGLRSYAVPPTVWGGDPACAHAWGDEARGPWANAVPGPNSPGMNAGRRNTTKGAGAWCAACGAWRGCLGLEPSVDLYVAHLVEVFRALRPALRDDGTLWLNLGDSYTSGGRASRDGDAKSPIREMGYRAGTPTGLKPKDLIGIPWRVAFALQADGWYLRSEITWAKRAPMPESIGDRPTSSTEKVFLFAKAERYFYDALAIAEPSTSDKPAGNGYKREARLSIGGTGQEGRWQLQPTRNARNFWLLDPDADDAMPLAPDPAPYWLLGPDPFPGSHFAVFPREIPRRAIRAGTSAAGECVACGTPWVRVVERHRVAYPNGIGGGAENQQVRAVAGIGATSCFVTGEGTSPVTTGWRPRCACDGPARPQLVLDPFVGSGTSALVAVEEGRDWLGCDLDPRSPAWTAGRLAKAQRRLQMGVA